MSVPPPPGSYGNQSLSRQTGEKPEPKTLPTPLSGEQISVMILACVMVSGIPSMFIVAGIGIGIGENPTAALLIWGLLAVLAGFGLMFWLLHLWARSVHEDHVARIEETEQLRRRVGQLNERVSTLSHRVRSLEK